GLAGTSKGSGLPSNTCSNMNLTTYMKSLIASNGFIASRKDSMNGDDLTEGLTRYSCAENAFS
ncbi:4246_t:CDS:1, partial [Acaulospora colombiana]